MDNIIWIIIAAAVTIALGGILLFAGSGTLGDVTDSATEILNTEPEDTQGFGEDNQQSNGNTDTSNGDSSQDSDNSGNGGIGCPGIGGC